MREEAKPSFKGERLTQNERRGHLEWLHTEITRNSELSEYDKMLENDSDEEGAQGDEETYVRERASTNFKDRGSLHNFSLEEFRGMSVDDDLEPPQKKNVNCSDVPEENQSLANFEGFVIVEDS